MDKQEKRVRSALKKLGLESDSGSDSVLDTPGRRRKSKKKKTKSSVHNKVRRALAKAGVLLSSESATSDDSSSAATSGTDSSSPASSAASTSDSEDDHGAGARRKNKRHKGKVTKSGRVTTTRCKSAKVKVEWPHYGGVYKGRDRSAPLYDDLTMSEFVWGYIGQVLEPKNARVKERMLVHLKDLMQDASHHTTDWKDVRDFNGLVMEQMERSRLTWDDATAIDKLRQSYLYRPTPNLVPCPAFQNGECKMAGDHDNLKHMCSHCFNASSKQLDHGEASCFNKHGRKLRGKKSE